jgi:ribonuclease P protein component
METYDFSRESRLLTPGQFQNVFNNPTRFGSRHFTILVTKNPAQDNRLGLAIAKKRVKLAVQRNRIKRLVRESFRLNQKNIPHVDMVAMVKSGIDKLDNQVIADELAYIWRKLRKSQKK